MDWGNGKLLDVIEKGDEVVIISYGHKSKGHIYHVQEFGPSPGSGGLS